MLLWLVLTLTVKERWLDMCNRNLHDCIRVSIPALLRFGHLCNWVAPQTWRWIRTGNPSQFSFLWTWKGHKTGWKNEVTKVKEKINETVKHCLSKINVLHGLFLGVSAIKRSVLRGNVIWDLKMMSAIEKCPLQRGSVIRVWPSFQPFPRGAFVVERCPL